VSVAPQLPRRQDTLGEAVLEWFEQNSAQGILITDAALVVRGWNNWLVGATGLAREAVVGRPLFEVLPSLVERGLDQHYADALVGQVKILSHTFHRFVVPTTGESSESRGQMPQAGRIAPLVDASGVIGTITVLEDVSERVASEAMLRERIATAEAASRVKDEFLATLSHEIRTPLNAVLGWTNILRSRQNIDAATLRRAIDVIDRNATAQLRLVSDMLDMARISTGKARLEMAEIDLGAIAIAAVDAARPAADAKGVRLITDLAPQLPSVMGDSDRILQVIWNLLSNAVKFTNTGGQVTLSLSTEARMVVLTVADTGHGIEAAFLPHVFERFKQADPSSSRRHGGLGLGLALVKELVALHGGTVSVASAGLNEGATFKVRLPARRRDETLSRRPPKEAVAARGALRGLRVLVVEDDPDANEILVSTITEEGGTGVSASSVDEALLLLRQGQGESPHVIVSDIGMPDHDGYSFLRSLRALPSDCGGAVPVIAVTAYATPEDRAAALRAGFDAHLGKPFRPDALVAAILRAVES
jgi:signal transduction histidine kinase/ActR/RegA family two-component response regulator